VSESTEVAMLPPALNAVAVFSAGGVDDVLAQIRAKVATVPKDISTPENRDAIRKAAYAVARSKTALDDMGKSLVEDAKAKIKVVDAERKRIRDTMDEIKDEVRKPLTDWEEAEKTRVADHEKAIEEARVLCLMDTTNATVADIDAQLAKLETYAARKWEEFQTRFDGHYGHVKDVLTGFREAIVQREAEKAELIRLRAEQEAREKAEREAEIARQAAEAARLEAEKKAAKAAQEAADRAEAEQRRIEAEKAAALQAAEDARLAAEKEAADKLATEQAERAKVERERQEAQDRAAKAEADAKAAAAKAEADRKEAERLAAQREKEAAEKAERDKQAAIEAERQRVAAQAAKEKSEAEAREKDKKHKATVNNAAMSALVKDAAISEDAAKAVITAIAKGLIPHVKISY
jgi:colicin import membrane protein